MLGQLRLERASYCSRHRKGSQDRFSSMCLNNWLSFICPPSGSISESIQTNHLHSQTVLQWKAGAVIFQIQPSQKGWRSLAAFYGTKHQMGTMLLYHLADVSLNVLMCWGQLCTDCTGGTQHRGWPWPRDLKREMLANPTLLSWCSQWPAVWHPPTPKSM